MFDATIGVIAAIARQRWRLPGAAGMSRHRRCHGKGRMNVTDTGTSPDALREAMITRIKELGYTLSAPVEQALRAVERHAFVPEVELADAYSAGIVVTKRGSRDEVLSCLSEPGIVALQLGQLDVQPGHRVLEIGAGTGYTAALMASLVGPHGHVITVDVDADIVADARANLANAGFDTVQVVLGDGALGYPDGGPYDRIVAAVGAFGIPDGWLAQLAQGGRLVVPLRIMGSVSRSIAFERDDAGGWRSVDDQMCGFVPLRNGIADDPRGTSALAPDGSVIVHVNQELCIDPATLVGVLDQPRTEAWTSVTFGPMESLEWLFLWLACTEAGRLCRMAAQPGAVESGVVDPMFPASALAVVGEGELAYLTWRAADGVRDRREGAQIGVIGHGPRGSALAERVAGSIQTWNDRHRQQHVRFEIPADRRDSSDPARGRFFLDRPHNPITVTWQ
jgi:protein-L-isoaspartate(D-aspartate) O-methyltransferase